MHAYSSLTSRTRTIGLSTVVASLAIVALAGSAQADGESETPYSRPCFMVRSHWNVALDGPQPLCPVLSRTS